MKMVENEEKSLKDFLRQNVVVKYRNPAFIGNPQNEDKIVTSVGIMTEYFDDEEDDDGHFSGGYIVVQDDTDYDRISLKDLIKIYIKEDKEE